MWTWLLVPAAALGFALFAGRALPRRGLFILGGLFAVIGIGAVAALEWRYTPEHTTPLTMPLALAKAGQIQTPPFAVTIPGPYSAWLVFDHTDAADTDFDCLTGRPGAEALCPHADPVIDLAWSVSDGSTKISQGHTDWSAWHARQAALFAPDAAPRPRTVRAKPSDGSDRLPLFYELGHFTAAAGHRYAVALYNGGSAGLLAQRHPRLVIGLSAAATRGLGAIVTIFGLLWVIAGAILILNGIRRGAAA
ncbi:MAG: hypothetical protein WDM91_05260 [Rhizomicrobium sp.]